MTEWRKVVPQGGGKTPESRAEHSLNYLPHICSLVVYGGKKNAKVTKYFDDLHVYNLKNATWLVVEVHGFNRQPRTRHCSCVY
jgi:hypothetical protein